MADNHNHEDHDHGHVHVHHEGEETCTDPTHHHHHNHAPQAPFVRAAPKIGRNELCHCGSGKKFKKCHGA